MAYSAEQIEVWAGTYRAWVQRADHLEHALVHRVYSSEASRPLARHGLVRRLRTLLRCIDRVYNIIPPDAENVSRDERYDAAIYLQAFLINAFGALDNLARLWVWESGLKRLDGEDLRRESIGLGPRKNIVRNSLSVPFQNYLSASDGWFRYLENYRHAIAHRIPLYVPPKRLKGENAERYEALNAEREAVLQTGDFDRFHELIAEQQALGEFQPLMMHSFGPTEDDGRPVFFHGQLISDLAKIVEISEMMVAELEALPRD